MRHYQAHCCCVYLYQMDATTREMLPLVFSRFAIPYALLNDLSQLPTHPSHETREWPFLLAGAHLALDEAQQVVHYALRHPELRLALIADALQTSALPLVSLHQQHPERVCWLWLPISIKRLLRYLAGETTIAECAKE